MMPPYDDYLPLDDEAISQLPGGLLDPDADDFSFDMLSGSDWIRSSNGVVPALHTWVIVGVRRIPQTGRCAYYVQDPGRGPENGQFNAQFKPVASGDKDGVSKGRGRHIYRLADVDLWALAAMLGDESVIFNPAVFDQSIKSNIPDEKTPRFYFQN
jgi:hypothetical protein